MQKYSELIAFIADNGDRVEGKGLIAFPKERMDLVIHRPEARALFQEALEAGAIIEEGDSYAVTDDMVQQYGNYDPNDPLGSMNPSNIDPHDDEEDDWELDPYDSNELEEDSNDEEEDDWEEDQGDWHSSGLSDQVNRLPIFLAGGGVLLSLVGMILRMASPGVLSTLGLVIAMGGVLASVVGLIAMIRNYSNKWYWAGAGGGVLLSLLFTAMAFSTVKEVDVQPEVQPAVSHEQTTSQETTVASSSVEETSQESTVQSTQPVETSAALNNGVSPTYADNVEISIEAFQIAQDSQGRTLSRLPVTLKNVTEVPLAYNFTVQAFDAQGNPIGSPDFILGYTLQPNTPQKTYTYEYRLPDEIEQLTAPGVTFRIVDISESGLDMSSAEEGR